MASVSDISVRHIASSLADHIKGSDSAASQVTTPSASLAQSVKAAFDGLIKAHGDLGHAPADLPVAPLAPFSSPPITGKPLMGSLQEALGAFHDLTGIKQQLAKQLSAQGIQAAGIQAAGIQAAGMQIQTAPMQIGQMQSAGIQTATMQTASQQTLGIQTGEDCITGASSRFVLLRIRRSGHRRDHDKQTLM